MPTKASGKLTKAPKSKADAAFFRWLDKGPALAAASGRSLTVEYAAIGTPRGKQLRAKARASAPTDTRTT